MQLTRHSAPLCSAPPGNISTASQAEAGRRAEAAGEQGQLKAHEVGFTPKNDLLTENPTTEQSMLAPHRVNPNHLKGLSK